MYLKQSGYITYKSIYNIYMACVFIRIIYTNYKQVRMCLARDFARLTSEYTKGKGKR